MSLRKDEGYKREFISWFRSLPQDGSMVRFFDLGPSLNVYGPMAPELALSYLKTKQVVSSIVIGKKDKPEMELEYVQFRHNIASRIINELVSLKQKKVEVYEVDEDASSGSQVRGFDWRIKCKASPGNTIGMEDILGLLGDDSTQYNGCSLMAVSIKFQNQQFKLGVGMVNAHSLRLEICEFTDTSRFSNLQSLVMAKGVKECIYMCNQENTLKDQMKAFRQTMAKCCVQVNETKKQAWPNMKDLNEMVSKLQIILTEQSAKRLDRFCNSHSLSIQALTAQLEILNFYSDADNHKKFDLTEYHCNSFMKLDAPAMLALNLFPSLSDTNKNMSVYGILNKCKSAMGSRLLQTWIRQPSIDFEEITKRQKLITIFKENSEQMEMIHKEYMKGMPDLERIKLQIQRNKAGLKECVALFDFCKRIQWIRDEMRQMKNVPFTPIGVHMDSNNNNTNSSSSSSNSNNLSDSKFGGSQGMFDDEKAASPMKMGNLHISSNSKGSNGANGAQGSDDEEEDFDIKMDGPAARRVKSEKNERNGANGKNGMDMDGDGSDGNDANDAEKIRYSALSCDEVLNKVFLKEIKSMWSDFNNFMVMIEHIVDLDRVAVNRDYLIKPEFDEQLGEYHDDKTRLKRKMEQLVKKIDEGLGLTKNNKKAQKGALSYTFKESFGYHLRVTKNASSNIWGNNCPARGRMLDTKSKSARKAPRTAKKGKKGKNGKNGRNGKNKKYNDDDDDLDVANYNVLSKVTSAVHFTNDTMSELSKRLVETDNNYKKRQQLIVDKTVQITATYMPVINRAITVFSELDVILSLAHLAHNAIYPYVCPRILPMGSGVMRMQNARHPCLELQENIGALGGFEAAQPCVPNDVSMVRGRSSFQIVTGPNMGGKSTYIRMIGIITLLAQIGSYVPCDAATLTIVDSVLARVGAGDSEMKGVSTFMQEMLETSSILTSTTCDSLVIVDELGRGTSTYDGYGIAYAISEELACEKKCFCLFATHFHELTLLAKEHACVVNKHVTALTDSHNKVLKMEYKVEDGPITRSFGIDVAEMANFPNEVIAVAREKAKELETFDERNKGSGSASDAGDEVDFGSYMAMQSIVRQYDELKQRMEREGMTDEQMKKEIDAFKRKLEKRCDEEPNGLIFNLCHKIKKESKESKNKNGNAKVRNEQENNGNLVNKV